MGEVFYDALKKQGTPLRYIAQISPRLSLSVPFTFLSFRPLSWLLHPRRPFFDSKIVRVILLCKLVRGFCPPLARVLPLTRPLADSGCCCPSDRLPGRPRGRRCGRVLLAVEEQVRLAVLTRGSVVELLSQLDSLRCYGSSSFLASATPRGVRNYLIPPVLFVCLSLFTVVRERI